MSEHIETCAVAMIKPCRVSGRDHRWSGWPGAYCLDCFADDDMEFCIGTVCRCPCHDQLWKDFDAAMASVPKEISDPFSDTCSSGAHQG